MSSAGERRNAWGSPEDGDPFLEEFDSLVGKTLPDYKQPPVVEADMGIMTEEAVVELAEQQSKFQTVVLNIFMVVLIAAFCLAAVGLALAIFGWGLEQL